MKPRDEIVPFLVDGGFTDLTRLQDGRVMCQLCFGFFERPELDPAVGEKGVVWDVCRRCAKDERRQVNRAKLPPRSLPRS